MRIPISKRAKLLLENPKTVEQLLRATSLARKPEDGIPEPVEVDGLGFKIKLVPGKEVAIVADEPTAKKVS
jgi:hypothetical protein